MNNNKWGKKRIKKAEKKLRRPTMMEALKEPFGIKKKEKKEVKKKTKTKYVVIKGKAYKVAETKNNEKEKKASSLKKRLEAREKIRKGMFGV